MPRNKEKSDNYYLSLTAKRELEVLSKYSEVDYKNRIVSITYSYERATDIINSCVGSINHPTIKDEILSSISNFIHSVPDGFKVNYLIKIDDYEGYNQEDIMESISDSLEIFNYNFKSEHSHNNIKMSLLLAVGIIIFSWLFIICSFKIFGNDDTSHSIVHEIIYTVACVLLWEGIYLLFLPNDSYQDINYGIIKRLNNISLLDKDKNILITKNVKDFTINWAHESKAIVRFKRIFLLSSVGYLCFGFSNLPQVFTIAKSFDTPSTISLFICVILVSIICLLTAVSNLSLYYGYGKLIKYASLFNIICLTFILVNFALSISSIIQKPESLSIYNLVLSSLLVLVSIFGVIGSFVFKKINQEKTN